jgi:methyl-accepting chemotaxis protein
MSMSRSIKVKIMTLSILAVIFTALVMAVVVYSSKAPMINMVAANFKELGRSETSKIAKMVYDRCVSSHQQRQDLVNISLLVAHEQLVKSGEVVLDQGSPVQWSAINQLTQEATPVSLPALKIGGVWLGQNTDAQTATPLVDKVTKMVGGTATIFQRMNDKGDMLRVATTVIKEDGKRAVGTYIPAVKPDGSANPVITAVLRGETYAGTANVVGKNYLTSYEPIKDKAGNVVGILYVGVEEIDPELREWIKGLVVGKTGYVFVIQGKGDNQGAYIISKGGERDGENIWEAKDADGGLFIQDMIKLALDSPEGETAQKEYMWKNEGEDKARLKVSAVTYYGATDWVIGAGTYYSDFEDTVVAVGKRMNYLVFGTLVIALVLVAIGIFVSFWMASKISNPLIVLVNAAKKAAGGDLTIVIERTTLKDEVGQLIVAFNGMLKNTHQAVSAVYRAAADLAATSEELSAGADETGRAVNEVAHSTGLVAIGAQTVTTNISTAQDSLRRNAKAVEGIAKDIEKVAAFATEAATQGAQGRKSAEEGSAVIQKAALSVQATTKTVQSLGEKTNQIAQFIGIITGIADQTNLLALNAAIEAARAGEAGRGFAVVAEEVRKLAEESNQAAGNITELVKAISSEMQIALAAMSKSDHEVGEGALIVDQASQVLGQIVESVSGLTGKVKAISLAAEQINANTGEVVAAMDGVASVAEGNAAAAEQISSATEEQNASMEEISASANNLATLAQDLNQMVSRFKV